MAGHQTIITFAAIRHIMRLFMPAMFTNSKNLSFSRVKTTFPSDKNLILFLMEFISSLEMS